MRAVRPVLIALAAAALAGCNSGSSSTTAPVDTNIYTSDPATTAYHSSLNVTLASMTKTASGLYYRDLVTGTGATAAAGYTVRVEYSGWLVNGVQFDATEKRTPPYFEFLLNAGRVIKGWDEGVQGMQVGGTRQLIIPPALGYGENGSGSVPANAVLVFQVKLLQVR